MALEVKEVEEGTENSQQGQVPVVEIETQKMISELRAQINQLRSAPAQQSAPDQANLLEQLVAKISGINKPENNSSFSFEYNYLSEAEIDPNDVLPREEQITFISHSVGSVIVDDLRNGKPIRVPFGKIDFKYESTKQVKNGKESEVHNFSKYTCKSRKELEWLRAHSQYNITFFENIKGAMSMDTARAIKLAVVMRSMSTMGSHETIQMARGYGITVNENITALRGEIAKKLVDDQIEAEKQTTQRIVQDSHFDRMMLEKQ